jgi:hypothetical protein
MSWHGSKEDDQEMNEIMRKEKEEERACLTIPIKPKRSEELVKTVGLETKKFDSRRRRIEHHNQWRMSLKLENQIHRKQRLVVTTVTRKNL